MIAETLFFKVTLAIHIFTMVWVHEHLSFTQAYDIAFVLSDSLKLSSALSVGLAVLFVVVTAAIVMYKLAAGTVSMPRLFPDFDTDASTILTYFSVVPVLVTAYICHHSSKFLVLEHYKAH